MMIATSSNVKPSSRRIGLARSAPVWPCFSRVMTLPMSWRYAAIGAELGAPRLVAERLEDEARAVRGRARVALAVLGVSDRARLGVR